MIGQPCAQFFLKRYTSVSVEAHLRTQVKRSGRSQNQITDVIGSSVESVISGLAHLRTQVKRSGRSQSRRLQKGLPV